MTSQFPPEVKSFKSKTKFHGVNAQQQQHKKNNHLVLKCERIFAKTFSQFKIISARQAAKKISFFLLTEKNSFQHRKERDKRKDFNSISISFLLHLFTFFFFFMKEKLREKNSFNLIPLHYLSYFYSSSIRP